MKKITVRQITWLFLFLFGMNGKTCVGMDNARLTSRVKEICSAYFDKYQDPKTKIIYNAPCGSKMFVSIEEVKKGTVKGKAKPYGYGSGLSDTALYTGHLLWALCEVYDVKPDPQLAAWARELFSALKYIGTTSPVPGFVPRGPHPKDRSAYYRDSSMDQHTTYILALWRYGRTSLASNADKKFIADSLNKVALRLEKYNWEVWVEDGSRMAHVGHSWLGFRPNHVSLLLPVLAAVFDATGNKHWQEAYEKFSAEENGKRWQCLAGKKFEIPGHPLYANQMSFRLAALQQIEKNPQRNAIVKKALCKAAQVQLRVPYPSGKYIKPLTREELATLGWEKPVMNGAIDAWNHFNPKLMKSGTSKIRARISHICVRYPLGGFTMAMLSGDPGVIAKVRPVALDMIQNVGDTSVHWGETQLYLSILALQLYRDRFSQLKDAK